MPLTIKEVREQFEKSYTNENTLKSKVNDVKRIIDHFNPQSLTELISIDVAKLKQFLESKYKKTTTQSSIANSLFTLSKIMIGEGNSQELYKLASTKWLDKNVSQIRGMTKKALPMSPKTFENKMTSFIRNTNNDPYERFIISLLYHMPRRAGSEFTEALVVSNEEFNKLKPSTKQGLFNIDTLQFYRHTSKNRQPINVDYNHPDIKKTIEDGALKDRKTIFTKTKPTSINYFVNKLTNKVLGLKLGSQDLRVMFATRRKDVSDEEFKNDALQLGHSIEVHSTYVNRTKLDKMSQKGKELYIESRDLIQDILINLNDHTKVKELQEFTKMIKECHKTILGKN